MISPTSHTNDHDARILVVGERPGGGDLCESLRKRYPEWSVTHKPTFLSGIADLGERSATAVLVCIDHAGGELADALAGLRKVSAPNTRLVLCCSTPHEPKARQAVQAGADDYVLFPFQDSELDDAIGFVRLDCEASAIPAAEPVAGMEELSLLADVLSSLDGSPRTLLTKIAGLVRLALDARGVRVVVQGAAVTDGLSVDEPVLSTALESGGSVLGSLCVSAKAQGSYTPSDARKLDHYARVVGQILSAASSHRDARRLAMTDECSGLPNRRFFRERLDAILTSASAEQFPVTLLLFDVDDFKSYNDRFGHAAGDEVIRATGELFRKHCREQDIVTRFGGDEFAVVFWDASGPRVAGSKHPECALAVLDRVKQALKRQKISSIESLEEGTLTISGGLATYPWDATSRDELLQRADEALLAAKRAGKNRIYLIGEGDTP